MVKVLKGLLCAAPVVLALSGGCRSRQLGEVKQTDQAEIEANRKIPACRKTGWDLAEKKNPLASPQSPQFSSFAQRRANIVDCFLRPDLIELRVTDLTVQLKSDEPIMRSWERDSFSWKTMSKAQILTDKNQDPNFENVLMQAFIAAAEVEAPVNSRTPGYGGESFFYLNPLYPTFARFVGGERVYDYQDSSLSRASKKGPWEQEEFGHSKHFKRIWETLSGKELEEFTPQKVSPLSYRYVHVRGSDGNMVQKSVEPLERVRQHLLKRIAAEVSASTGYIWMLSHTTGDLQRAIAQPFEDELGHLAKFWVFYRWAFKDSEFWKTSFHVSKTLVEMVSNNAQDRSTGEDLAATSTTSKLEIIQVARRVLETMASWDARNVTPVFLSSLFDEAMGQESTKLRSLPPRELASLFHQKVDEAERKTLSKLKEQNPSFESDELIVDPVLLNKLVFDAVRNL